MHSLRIFILDSSFLRIVVSLENWERWVLYVIYIWMNLMNDRSQPTSLRVQLSLFRIRMIPVPDRRAVFLFQQTTAWCWFKTECQRNPFMNIQGFLSICRATVEPSERNKKKCATILIKYFFCGGKELKTHVFIIWKKRGQYLIFIWFHGSRKIWRCF